MYQFLKPNGEISILYVFSNMMNVLTDIKLVLEKKLVTVSWVSTIGEANPLLLL